MRVRKRYVAAALTGILILVGGLWLTLGVMTAPSWVTGQSWTYRADDGSSRWNVTFLVDERVNLTGEDAWRVNVTHESPEGARALTRFFLVDTLDEIFPPCEPPMRDACGSVHALFNYPLVAGESWEWERQGSVPTTVQSHASVWMGDATVTHRFTDGVRLEYAFRDGDPFYSTRTQWHADGSVENWWLTGS